MSSCVLLAAVQAHLEHEGMDSLAGPTSHGAAKPSSPSTKQLTRIPTLNQTPFPRTFLPARWHVSQTARTGIGTSTFGLVICGGR